MDGGYGAFARFYDAFTENVEYISRGEYYHSLIQRFGGRQNGVLLDLACGTGSFSVVFDDLGYDVTGVDNSEDMLSEAERKNGLLGKNIRYILQDMRMLELPGTVDVAVCALDSLNHLDSIGDVKKVFDRVYEYTENGGLFLFDMNTVYKHREILGDNSFIFENDDVFLAWQNECEGNRVNIYLDFFVHDGNGRYERYSEDISEIAYPAEEISAALEQSGFAVMGIYAENSFDPPDDETERIVFAAKKIKG